jgi:DNA-binding HxlR family transcriptional regulator
MLTLTHRCVEHDGLVIRSVTPSVPPRVDYELTELGESLREPAMALGRWATEHQEEIRSARTAFDQASTKRN